MADNTIKIGGELESMATGKIVAAASAIKDKSRNKTQEVINGDVEAAIATQLVRFEALSEETSRGVASASQSARESKQYLADLQEAITGLPDGQAVSAQVAVNEVDIAGLKPKVEKSAMVRDSDSNANLDVSDPNGYVIARFSEGHVQTKKFDSRNVARNLDVVDDDSNADLNISDADGNVISRFAGGDFQTKNFNSANIKVEKVNGKNILYLGK